MADCIKCGKELSFKEIGAYKKFINRGSTEYMCIKCLANELNITEEYIEEKIEQFKKQGCALFM